MEHKDSKEVQTEFSAIPQKSPSDRKWQTFYKNGPLLMLTGVFLLVIFMIIIYYEARLRSGEYGMMEYRPQMMHYENITTPDWNEWEQESDGYWQKFDHRIAAMMEHNNRVFQNLETLPTSENPIGKYSGTKVVNNDSFTYSLEVGTGSLTGSISGTDSGTIESVVKDISNLGYKVSKVDGGGYSILGGTGIAREVLDILGR